MESSREIAYSKKNNKKHIILKTSLFFLKKIIKYLCNIHLKNYFVKYCVKSFNFKIINV